MGYQIDQPSRASVEGVARGQHWVITRSQLLELGLSAQSIKQRLAQGRLHRVGQGVYTVGRPELSRHGCWMAAVLSSGPGALLSHLSAAELWGIWSVHGREVHVSVPLARKRGRPDLMIHRRSGLDREDQAQRYGIPVTSPTCTLVDVAPGLRPHDLEATVNAADKLGLTNPEKLRSELDSMPARPGVGILRRALDFRTFTLTDSELERRFLPLVARAGLPKPETARFVNGFKVDFYWPGHGLVVETDGLRYHRTPAQQARDRLRDQTHTAAGLTTLRFTHAQVSFETEHVEATLAAVAARLAARPHL